MAANAEKKVSGNLIEVMSELRDQCEALCSTAPEYREPIRDRIWELVAAYIRLTIPESQLIELKTELAIEHDTKLTRILLETLNKHEHEAGVSVADIHHTLRRIAE